MTQAEAVTWANTGWRNSSYARNLPGVGFGIDVDGVYGQQCFDFSSAYSLYLGLGRLTGKYAYELWETAPGVYQRVQDPLPGDIFVHGSGYNSGPGHTGVVTEVRAGRNRWVGMSQNFNPPGPNGSPPVPAEFTAYQIRGFLRPPLTNNGGAMTPTQIAEVRLKERDEAIRLAQARLVEIEELRRQNAEYLRIAEQRRVELEDLRSGGDSKKLADIRKIIG